MSTVPGFPDATSPTPETGLLWLTEGSGSTRDKKVQAGTLVTDLLGRAVNSQAAAATPIVGATDLLPVARGNTGGKASVNAVVGAGFAGAIADMAGASTLVGTETLPALQGTSAKALPVSSLFPSVLEFDGMGDILSTALVVDIAPPLAQYRIIVHKGAAGEIPVSADLHCNWAPALGEPGAWRFPDAQAALGSAFSTALRMLWGIGPTDEWVVPRLFGTMRLDGGVHVPVDVWNGGGDPAASYFKIWDWTATEEATSYGMGYLHLHIPGRPVP